MNKMGEFKAFVISKQDFEKIWSNSKYKYQGSLEFPTD